MDKDSDLTDTWEYLDFDLEVGEGGPREYPLLVRSPAGEAREEMHFPFDELELKDRLQALEIALLRSGGTRRRIPSPHEHTVQDFGRGLFESLLVGDVRTRYEMSLSEARRQGKGLRLKLRIHPPELAMLPWEFLYDVERDRYPSLSSNTPLVRYLDLPQPVEPLPVSPPLRVLGMVTSPSGLDLLDIEHEKRVVEEAISRLREDGLLELTWLEGQTWRHVQRAMRRGHWHVFHFVGHGGFEPATEEGAIALSDEAGHKRLLRATSLAELLDDHYPLRLVFLNSCEGARGSESDAFSSTAATLVRRGVPAVVAMQYEITDKAAIEFSRDFYEAVADGLPVDAAVTEARAAVSVDSMLEWGTPVLYMRSPDGRLFDVSGSIRRAPTTPETGYWQSARVEREVSGGTVDEHHERQEETTHGPPRGESHKATRAPLSFPYFSGHQAFRPRPQRTESLQKLSTTTNIVASNVDQIQLVGTLKGHTNRVKSVAFSPDGELLACGSDDETVKLWRPKDGAILRTLKGHTNRVNSVAFSPDGELLASGSDDETVRLWRSEDGKLVRTLERPGGANSLAFSPDGRLLVSSSGGNRQMCLWGIP